MRYFALALTVICVLWTYRPVQAQMGKTTYHFENRAQVRDAVLKNLHNLRASYNIITCAGKQGMIRTVLQTYEQKLAGPYNSDPDICSSYALAHQFFTWRPTWEWPEDTDKSIRVRGFAEALQVQDLRLLAMKAKPHTPEVLLGDALFQCFQSNGRPIAVREMREVVQRAPRWADGQYWYANALSYYGMVIPREQKKALEPRYGALMIRALHQAERLDPQLLPSTYLDRQYAYRLLNQPKEALASFDSYAQALPGFATDQDRRHGKGTYAKWRQWLVDKTRQGSFH